MKKLISYILLTVILAIFFCGCGKDEKEMSGTPNLEEIQGTNKMNGQEEAGDPKGLVDGTAVSYPGEQDNSLDVYSAVVHMPLLVEKPMNALEGGGRRIFLGASRAFYFKKHLFDNVDECWDELSFVTAEGETDSESFGWENQLWGIGPVASTDHYVTFDYEVQENGEDCRYFLTERDENHEVLREFPLDFLRKTGSSEVEVIVSFSDFAVDYSGRVHLVRQMDEEWQYQLVSTAGEVLAEYIVEDGMIEGLFPLYDGRVAFGVTKWDDEGQSVQTALQYMDAEAGRPVVLAAMEKEIYCFTLLDENTLLSADQQGVYRSGLSGKNPELLYCWDNHGITVQGISAMQADEEGLVALIYKDSENYNYLCLKPTTEEVEICEITLAVSPYSMSVYQPMVVEFNKQYPRWHIELKNGYDEAALLTELIAGKGPVLIDTSLTGFEEQEKLWEPLDMVLEQLGVADKLQLSAMEMGKINGTLYGIVTDFSLRTLITGNPDLKDWDYDTFLQCIEDRPELEAIFDLYGGGDYGSYFIMNFLGHGIEDTYLLDVEEGTTNFDSSEFRRALELAKKYCVREEGVSPGSSVLEGKVLCNELRIKKPEELAAYRICYGEGANYIGYPAKDGAVHFMVSGCSPLVVRRTVTEEEKEVAFAFIGWVLSYEGQVQAAKDLNYGLSVRKDVLEEQIAAMNESTEVFVPGFGQIMLGDSLDIELDRKTLLHMIEKARPLRYFPTDLRNIMNEELEQYFSGLITEDMVIDHLESRVGLYLEERN